MQNELKSFSPKLFSKPQILVASKVDHPEAREKFLSYEERLRELNPVVLAISSVTGEGLSQLLWQIKEMRMELKVERQPGEE